MGIGIPLTKERIALSSPRALLSSSWRKILDHDSSALKPLMILLIRSGWMSTKVEIYENKASSSKYSGSRERRLVFALARQFKASGIICSLPGLWRISSLKNWQRNCDALTNGTFMRIVELVEVIKDCCVMSSIAE